MRTLVVGDVHLRIDQVRQILDRFSNVDRRVFVGDFFDDFDDSVERTIEMAEYARDVIAADSHTRILFGNHDIQYAIPFMEGLLCSGWAPGKAFALKDPSFQPLWERFEPYTYVDQFLVTHAGVHRGFIEGYESAVEDRLRQLWQEATDALAERRVLPLLSAGPTRGGAGEAGGITWLDWNREFEPVAGLSQIVGHTPDERVRLKEDKANQSANWNVDTYLRQVVVVEDGEVVVHAI